MKNWICIALLFSWAAAFADNVVILEIDRVDRYNFEERILKIDKDIQLHIKASGAEDRYGDDMLATGWILDSRTREVVWEMTPDNSRRSRSRYLREVEETINLKKGVYEVYYAVSPMGIFSGTVRDLGDFFGEIFGGRNKSREYRRNAEDWGMTLSVDKKEEKAVSVEDMTYPAEDAQTLVQFSGLGDNEYLEQGISIQKGMEVRIYAIGEGENGDMFDYGWITDAKTGEMVWQMRYRQSDWAGGAEKNRKIDTTIRLEKGDYLVTFVTDGSHSYDEWNMMPPRDPRYWGMTIWSTDADFNKARQVTAYEPKESEYIIVDFTRAGDDFFEEHGFTLKKKMPLRVRCLGEMGSGNKFADYGWILNADTRETVWEMDRRNTRHAGGGSKNRIFDAVITLDAGNYVAHYVTDGSHSYRSWNTGAPFNQRAWGLTIWGHTENFNPADVVDYVQDKDAGVLVSLIRAEDNERLRGKFTLDRDSRVRIYCLGEGSNDEMVDYGLIEDEDGRVVWEMEYWDTEHAGGGMKNRMINEVIKLRKGSYRVLYRTDGSHSYKNWNDDPPKDPKYWGITVRMEK